VLFNDEINRSGSVITAVITLRNTWNDNTLWLQC
jgi:hypothetical protein